MGIDTIDSLHFNELPGREEVISCILNDSGSIALILRFRRFGDDNIVNQSKQLFYCEIIFGCSDGRQFRKNC